MIEQSTQQLFAKERHYVLVTDGSCTGGRGPGGWAALIQLVDDGIVIRQQPIVGHSNETTNNKMEMMGPLEGLKRLRETHIPVRVLSDSQYVILGISERLPGWKAKGWRTTKGAVQNKELWQSLEQAAEGKTISWEWVKGHNGHELNELVDGIAEAAKHGTYRHQGSLLQLHRGLFIP